MTCMRQRAPREETARGLNPLSTRTSAASRNGSRAFSWAVAAISRAKGIGNRRRRTGIIRKGASTTARRDTHKTRRMTMRTAIGANPPRLRHTGVNVGVPMVGVDELGRNKLATKRHNMVAAYPRELLNVRLAVLSGERGLKEQD